MEILRAFAVDYELTFTSVDITVTADLHNLATGVYLSQHGDVLFNNHKSRADTCFHTAIFGTHCSKLVGGINVAVLVDCAPQLSILHLPHQAKTNPASLQYAHHPFLEHLNFIPIHISKALFPPFHNVQLQYPPLY
jgi:hypothetical protein